MSSRIKDGVIINKSVFIIDEKKSGFPLLNRAFQLLAILIGGFSSFSILMEAFQIPANMLSLYATMLITTGVLFGLCLLPNYDVVKEFFGILFYGLFFFSRLPRIQNGFYIIENLVMEKVSSYYELKNIQFVADYSVATKDTTLFLIMVLLPLITLLAVAIIRNKLVAFCGFLLSLPISATFLIGKVPSEHYMIECVIVTLYLLHSSYRDKHVLEKEQKVLRHRISSKVAVWLSVLCLVLFFTMKLFVTQEQYEKVTKIEEVKKDVQTALYNFSWEDFSQRLNDLSPFKYSVATGGLSGGDLGKTGQVKYTNQEHLRITAPFPSISEGIYLKGYVGSVYTGDRWEKNSELDDKKYQMLMEVLPIEEFAPVNQVNLFLNHLIGKYVAPSDVDSSKQSDNTDNPNWSEYNIYQGTMTIDYKRANKEFLYAPYFTNYELVKNTEYQQDLYCAPTRLSSHYVVDYFFQVSIGDDYEAFFVNLPGKLGNYKKQEKLYRNYVYQVYTKLPEEGLVRLKNDFSKERVHLMTNSIGERINYVKNYLEKNTEYSLSPGKLPRGKDFVEYFLYENKVGYCAHYASAATLMLRAMGVPARYVEGYAVGEQDLDYLSADGRQDILYHTDQGETVNVVTQSEASVKDSNAHAWVEVYIDNCGWLPVEVTPGSTVDYNNTVVADMEQIGEHIKANDNAMVTQTPVEQAPELQDLEDRVQMDQSEQEVTAKANNKAGGKNANLVDLVFLVLIVILSAAAGIWYVIRRMNNKRRRLQTRNYSKKALLLFHEIEKILAYTGALPQRKAALEDNEEYVKERCRHCKKEDIESLMEIARKARFSKNRITESELKTVETFHQNLYTKMIQELPKHKKIYIRFLLM